MTSGSLVDGIQIRGHLRMLVDEHHLVVDAGVMDRLVPVAFPAVPGLEIERPLMAGTHDSSGQDGAVDQLPLLVHADVCQGVWATFVPDNHQFSTRRVNLELASSRQFLD
jgi:hypothetical protein